MKVRWFSILTWLASPACLAALAPYGADLHWTVDLLACFPVQASAALTLAVAAFAIGRKWWRTALFAAFAAAGWSASLAGPGLAKGFPESVENPTEIRVLTANLLYSNDEGAARLLEVVRRRQPDAIWCAEYTPAWQKLLRASLPDFPYRFERPDPGCFGAAVFSRHPFLLKEWVPLHHSWAPAARCVLILPSGPVGLLGVHPPPPGLSGRRVAERDDAIAAIPLLLENLPEDRIVLGDFNATRWNAPFRRMLEQTGLDAGSSRWWLPSWPDPLPAPLRIPIDHVLTAGRLRVVDAFVGASFGSDHRPVGAVLQRATR